MIGLADCNNFYASCERVFNPRLKNEAVIVLSNNDGCVIARNNEAKKLGVKMGAPVFKIKDTISKYNINVFSTNFALYGDMSERVMNTLKSEVDDIEIYSIDEAFLNFSDFIDKDRAIHIKKKVKQWTGIPVSIGIAPTKSLAKIANHVAKKYTSNGIFIINNDSLANEILKKFPIEEVWGIGRRFGKKLSYFNIKTALEFKNANSKWIKKNFSVNGLRLQKELKGEICYPLESGYKSKKNICTSRSFSKEIKNFSYLSEIVSSFANNCAYKLRKQKICCTKISVFLMTNRFKLNSPQHFPSITLNFDTPTNDSFEIVSRANKALFKIHNPKYSYKKAGVVVHNTSPESSIQTSLFDTIDRKKRQQIMKSMDLLNSKMGKNKIHLASGNFNRKWAFKREKLSPCYTTMFSDILKIQL